MRRDGGVGKVAPSGLQRVRRTLPAPATDQALVRVESTAVSFAESAMRRGRYYGQPAFPFVPGYDLVGVVEAVGPGVEDSAKREAFRARTRTDLTHVLNLLRDGVLTAQIAARFPLAEAAAALELAESSARTTPGKIILTP